MFKKCIKAGTWCLHAAALVFSFQLFLASSAFALTIGYVSLDNPTATYPESAITGAGHTAVALGQLTGADLSGIDMLWVLNGSNSGVSSDFTGNTALVNNFLANGGSLIFHDRYVNDNDNDTSTPGMAAILPGASGITFVRSFADDANIEIAPGAEALAAAMGVTSTSLDGGTSSSHGYTLLGSLPAGSVAVLTQADPTHIVDMYYRLNSGTVYYSTIPLDYYLGNNSIPGFTTYAFGLMEAGPSMIFVVVLPDSANTPNQRAILNFLNDQMPVAAGDFLEDTVTLANLPDGEFQAALDELSPEPYIGLRDSGLRVVRAGTATVQERLESFKLTKTAGIDGKLLFAAATETMTDTGPASAVTGKDGFSLWARPYRYVADQDGKDTFFGYKHKFFGVTVGADRALDENSHVGILFGKSSGDVEYDVVDAETDMESLYFGAYGALMNGDYYLHAQGAWFKHEFDTSRNLSFINRTASSSHDATEVAVSFGGEYLGLQTPCGWSVVPGLALEFSRYDEDDFTESGAGSYDLIGGGINETSLSSRLGVRVNKAYTQDRTVLVPELKVEWVHNMGDTNRDMTARFAGAGTDTFTVDGVDEEQNLFVVGLGVTGIMNETSAFFVNVDNEFASDYTMWGVSFGYKYSF